MQMITATARMENWEREQAATKFCGRMVFFSAEPDRERCRPPPLLNTNCKLCQIAPNPDARGAGTLPLLSLAVAVLFQSQLPFQNFDFPSLPS